VLKDRKAVIINGVVATVPVMVATLGFIRKNIIDGCEVS
jgi:hypothetical protein